MMATLVGKILPLVTISKTISKMGVTDSKLYLVKLGVWSGVLASVVLLNLQLEEILGIMWLYLSIPLLLSSLLLVVGVHVLLEENCTGKGSESKNYLLFCTYNLFISVVAFLILGSLLLDEVLDTYWRVVFIPFWYGLFIYGIFTVYMLPGMLDPKVNMRRQAFFLVLYFIGLSTSSILLVIYLDDEGVDSVVYSLLPLVVVLGFHFASYTVNRLRDRDFSGLLSSESLLTLSLIIALFLLMLERSEVDLAFSFIILPLYLYLALWVAIDEYTRYNSKDPELEPLVNN